MHRPRFDDLPPWPGLVLGALGGAAVYLAGYLLGATLPELPQLLDIHDARDIDLTIDQETP